MLNRSFAVCSIFITFDDSRDVFSFPDVLQFTFCLLWTILRKPRRDTSKTTFHSYIFYFYIFYFYIFYFYVFWFYIFWFYIFWFYVFWFYVFWFYTFWFCIFWFYIFYFYIFWFYIFWFYVFWFYIFWFCIFWFYIFYFYIFWFYIFWFYVFWFYIFWFCIFWFYIFYFYIFWFYIFWFYVFATECIFRDASRWCWSQRLRIVFYCSDTVYVYFIYSMDLAGNLRGNCRKHGIKCARYEARSADSHTCFCGCPAFEHVSLSFWTYINIVYVGQLHCSLNELVPRSVSPLSYNLRKKKNFLIPKFCTDRFRNSFIISSCLNEQY